MIEPLKINKKVGWKVFAQEEEGLFPEFGGSFKKTRNPYPIGRWITDTYKHNLVPPVPFPSFYKSGFHVFLRKKDARKWRTIGLLAGVVRKVQFDEVITTGRQGEAPVAVVRKMKISPNS